METGEVGALTVSVHARVVGALNVLCVIVTTQSRLIVETIASGHATSINHATQTYAHRLI